MILRKFLTPARSAELNESTGRGLIEMLRNGGSQTVAGVPVTADTALSFATVFACVRVLSESVGSLPLILYRRNGEGKERATDHPLYSLLHDAPNDEMTSVQLYEALMSNVVLWGNACARLVIDNTGQVREMWPLLSRYLEIKRVDGELLYVYNAPDLRQTFRRWEVFHVPGLTLNGITGLSVLGYMRRAIGLGLVLDQFSESFFENGARPGVVLEYPGQLKDKARDNISDSWNKRHAGPENAHKVTILEEGMKLHDFGIPPEDAQMLQSKKYQAEEIARMFLVQPHKVGIMDHATFTNIENQSISFVTDTLRTWLVRIEKRVAVDLLLKPERRDYYAEFLVDALLRGDTVTRVQAYNSAINTGWMTRNQARQKENMNPGPPELDKYLQPLNMTEAGSQTP